MPGVLPGPPADPLGAAALAETALAGWVASPARFREDANAEEDAALGGYRDSLVVELVQNGVDAAAAAGVPALVRLALETVGGVTAVTCASTGAPLTAPGLGALASLRASAKRGDEASVGRFGVGFSAVLAVTDAPRLTSRAVGVAYGFDREVTRSAVAVLPTVAGELAHRAGHVPVLRVPLALPADPVPDGYDTLVVLPLRPGAEPVARALLSGLDPTLPLALPGLAELCVVLDATTRVLRTSVDADGATVLEGRRWRVADVSADLDRALLADRPVEERGRRRVHARAALPLDGWPPGAPQVLRAPQPTDEQLTAALLVSVALPLEPTRRYAQPGPLRDALLGLAADAVLALAGQLRGDPRVLDLVPVGLAAGAADGVLRAAVLDRLRTAGVVPGGLVLDLGDASEAVGEVLADTVDGLLSPVWPARSAALATLGVRRLSTADVVDLVQGLTRRPGWWGALATALLSAPDREALAALPVPLADGRLAAGPRGVLLPDPDVDAAALLAAGVRLPLADPGAAVAALLSLGARPGTARALLDEPALREAVETDGDDPALVEAVLGVVAAASPLPEPGDLPWLAALDVGGDLVAGSPIAGFLAEGADLEPVPGELVERWGVEVLGAVGVLARPVVVRGEEAVEELDGAVDWLDQLAAPPVEPVAVADLELLRWPDALALLAADPAARAAVLDPCPLADGTRVASCSAWWLATHLVLGLPAGEVRAPDSDPLLLGLYDDPPPELDPAFAAALGCPRRLPEDPDGVLDLLDRVGDAQRTVTREQVRAAYRVAAAVRPDGDPPFGVRGVAPDGALRPVAPADALLVDRPDLLPLSGSRAVIPVPAADAEALADLLGVDLASEVCGELVGTDPLTARDVDGRVVPVGWLLLPDGTARWAGPEGQGRAQAWLAGEWRRRAAYVAALRDPASARLLALEEDLGG